MTRTFAATQQSATFCDAIKVDGTVIRLGQLLKVAALVENGGEAKARIQAGEVKVNGETELRRGRQLVQGDIISMAGRSLRLTYLEQDDP